MKHDNFFDRKSLHVTIDKEVYAALRSLLFRYGLSIQQVMEEVCRNIAEERNVKSMQILETLVKRNLQAAIKEQTDKYNKTVHRPSYGNIDAETIYSLLSDDEDEKNERAKSK